jgi:thiosulfate/3-mercaptopyruvate sulfurtransferase
LTWIDVRVLSPEAMPLGPIISPESLVLLKVPFRLIDARPSAQAFTAGHLEGAVHADLNRQLSSASEEGFDLSRGGRHPLPSPERWAAQLGAWGIGCSTFVVVYDATAGSNAACRVWWMLRAFGHANVAVLDGGFQAAQAAGLVTTSAPSEAVPTLAPYPGHGWSLPTVDIGFVERRAQEPNWAVLDVRSRERWRGDVEPLDPTPGRIPGTVNLPFSENLGPDGRYKSPADLRRMYVDLLGSTPPEHLVVHCGSGVTACHTLLALERAGLHGASLYVGSYSEWCRSGRRLGRG